MGLIMSMATTKHPIINVMAEPSITSDQFHRSTIREAMNVGVVHHVTHSDIHTIRWLIANSESVARAYHAFEQSLVAEYNRFNLSSKKDNHTPLEK